MLIQKIKGGLGNQMFQYAFIRSLSLRTNEPFLLDTTEYNYYKYRDYELSQLFNIKDNLCKESDLNFYQRLYSKNKYLNFICTKLKDFCIVFNSHHYVEKNMFHNKYGEKSIIDDKFFNIKKGYIEGYFQSLKYFKDYEDVIKKDLIFKKPLSKKSDEIRKKIEDTESVSIHVRRGDYLNKEYVDIYGICGIEYLKDGINFVKKKANKPLVFFVFSDDVSWCKQNLKYDNINFVDWNHGSDSWQDLCLMSYCKHNIIANSTFSWWGAELNRNPDKIVIAPKERYKKKNVYQNDIVPSSWTTI